MLSWPKSPGPDMARVHAESFDHEIAHDHGQAEGQKQRRQRIRQAHRAIDENCLQRIAERKRNDDHRQDQKERMRIRKKRGNAKRDEGRERDELAVHDVDDAGHAEHQRQSRPRTGRRGRRAARR